MSILVWSMVGIALWHFAVLVPDRFAGGIIGAFLAGWLGALGTGFLLPTPGLPTDNPPGIGEAIWAIPGALAALGATWFIGDRRLRQRAEMQSRPHVPAGRAPSPLKRETTGGMR